MKTKFADKKFLKIFCIIEFSICLLVCLAVLLLFSVGTAMYKLTFRLSWTSVIFTVFVAVFLIPDIIIFYFAKKTKGCVVFKRCYLTFKSILVFLIVLILVAVLFG
ncbi:MAG: hypothetical protein LBU60_03825 [Clostridiales bacterium]|jgi:hypothetical protein|nr:hypothetical protein [Clostridiales bacterium]